MRPLVKSLIGDHVVCLQDDMNMLDQILVKNRNHGILLRRSQFASLIHLEVHYMSGQASFFQKVFVYGGQLSQSRVVVLGNFAQREGTS